MVKRKRIKGVCLRPERSGDSDGALLHEVSAVTDEKMFVFRDELSSNSR